MSEPTTKQDPSSRPWFAGFLAVLVAVACVFAWYGTRGASDRPPADSGPVEIVSDRVALAAGDDVRVYWRALAPDDPTAAVTPPYEESFEITASAGADGRGAVTGEQLFTRFGHLPGGKVVKAWVREIAPRSPPDQGSTVVVTESPGEELSRWVRLDAKGRAVLFVDVQMGPKPEPEPDPEPDPENEPAPPP